MAADPTTIANTVRDLSTRPARLKDATFKLALETPWESYLAPAPMCIALLGQVQLIATTRDFSLTDTGRAGGFDKIKYPESFRATLMQISNSGADAFDIANRNMSEISLLSGGLPEILQEVFRVLVRAPTSDVEAKLPGMLSQVQSQADECKSLTSQTADKFQFVVDLISEVSEAITAKKGITQRKNEEAKSTLRAKESIQKTLAIQEKANKAQEDELKEAVKKGQERFEHAMDSMPSGWDIVGMNIVESFTKAFTSVLDRTLSMGLPDVTNIGSKSKDVQDHVESGGNNPNVDPNQIPVTVDKSLDQVETMYSAVSMLSQIEFDRDEKHTQAPTYVKETLDFVRKETKKLAQTDPAKKILSICDDGTKLCETASNLFRGLKPDPDEVKSFKDSSSSLLSRAQAVQVLAKAAQTRDMAPTISPGQSITLNENRGMSAGDIAQKNWQTSVELSQKQLENVRKLYQEKTKQLQDLQLKEAELIAEMATIKVEQINFDQIIAVINKAIDALGDLQAQWRALTTYFTTLASIVKVAATLATTVGTRAKNLEKLKLSTGGNMGRISIDLLYEATVRADQVVRIVSLISNEYVQVSEKYILGPVAKLINIVAMDADRDKDNINRLLIQLHKDSETAKRDIYKHCAESRAGFYKEIEERQQQIISTMHGLLQPVTSEEKKQISDAVDKAADISRKADEIKGATKKDNGYDSSFLG